MSRIRTSVINILAINLMIVIILDLLTELERDLCNKQSNLNGLNLLHIFTNVFMSQIMIGDIQHTWYLYNSRFIIKAKEQNDADQGCTSQRGPCKKHDGLSVVFYTRDVVQPK